MRTRIKNGRIIDPAGGIDRVQDLWIEDSRIASRGNPEDPTVQVIDATGCVVMAGGIDLHTHIGGGKISIARMLLADQFPSEYLPTVGEVSARYLDMGYTTCFEPAVIPCNARAAHAEMAGVQDIDTGGYCLLGNDDVLMSLIAEGSPQSLINDYVAWMVRATQCIAVKVVNPGGIHAFKFNERKFHLDSRHPKYEVTPAQIISTLCQAVADIGLSHPLHVHCSNLGVPGNIDTTLATIRAANGLPIHLTHAQFHSYALADKEDQDVSAMVSAAHRLAEAVSQHRNVTIDVGQVMFGQTVTISADTLHQHENFPHASPRKSVLVDVECEAGCGVVPFKYNRKRFVNSLQWAIGLELFLMIDDPSRVFLTTDHPNGGAFTTYPHLIRLLGDRTFRETALAEIHSGAASSCELAGIDREYSLSEIATMTRSAPASLLGLSDRGQLSAGCIADVVLYELNDNLETMFQSPRYVFRRGKMVRDHGEAKSPEGHSSPSITLKADVAFDPSSVPKFRSRYEAGSTFSMDRLWIDDEEMESVLGTTPLATGTTGGSP